MKSFAQWLTEQQQLIELSKKTLASYVKKAYSSGKKDRTRGVSRAADRLASDGSKKPSKATAQSEYDDKMRSNARADTEKTKAKFAHLFNWDKK